MIYAFGDHELDMSRFELRRAGTPQPVEPQVLELLAHLVAHRDRVVTREELLARVWGHVHVSDATVNSRIRAARAAVGDTGADQALIRTIRNRGYRFVGEVADADTRGDGLAVAPRPGEAAPAAGALPDPLRADGPLVGRDAELEALRGVWAEALEGAPRIACLEGEPGIGKTRLAAALAEAALQDGATVLYGCCSEEALTPLEPFADALGSLPGQLLPGGGAEDPAAARYRAFESVRSAVQGAARGAPCLLVLDDLHWSDPMSLLVLRHLVRTARREPLMLLLAYRDTDLAPDHPLRDALVDLRRGHRVRTVALRGLGADAVERLVAGTRAGPAPSLVALTGGNPFFIGEVVRAADEGDPAGGATADVTGLVSQRLRRLGPGVTATLEAAALLGAEFEVGDLEALSPDGAAAVPGHLERAEAARLIAETARPERYAFAHGLVRATLRHGMSAPRRRRLHLRIADVVEGRGAVAAEVAHHLLAAMPAGDPRRAVRAVREAAAAARRSLAYEDAAHLLRRALAGARAAGIAPPEECRLLLEIGDANARAGAAADARAAFVEAAGIARALGDADLLAEAALGAAGMAVAVLDRDAELEDLLRGAIAGLGDQPSAVLARLLARLAIVLRYADPGEADRLSERALEVARAPGAGEGSLATALTARRVAIWGPERPAERLAVADAIVRHARVAGDREAELHGRNWRVLDLLELGRADEAREEVEAFAVLAREVGLPHHLWYVPLWQATFACLEGRFDEAAELSDEARAVGRAAGDPNADNFHRIQEVSRLIEERRFADIDMDEGERAFVRRGRPATWAGAMAVIRCELGDPEGGRAAYDAVAADDFAALPTGVNWHVIADYAEAAALLGDAAGARLLYAILAPHRALCPVTARAVLCVGSAELFLGRLAAACGWWDPAVAHLEAAIAVNDRLGAVPRAATARWRLAQALARRGARADAERTRTLLAAAAAAADGLGMRSFAGEIEATRAATT